jgi:hypothetical protein
MINRLEAAVNGGKPFSSVSVWIDRLSANSYAEDDYEGCVRPRERAGGGGGADDRRR